MKKSIFLIALLGLLGTACTDNWNNRFNQDLPEETVWEIINSTPEYAEIAALLKEAAYDSLLDRNSVYTLLVPPSSALEALNSMDSADKAKVLGYHISNSVLYSNDIEDLTRLKTIIGKQILFEESQGEITLNQESGFVKTDIVASNGVIHEIDAALEIRPNLNEIIESSQDFSTIGDFILQGKELFFDEENSVQIGLDSIGRNIYDSVWITTNDFFDKYANLNSEDDVYTLFLANNTLLETTMEGSLIDGYLSTFPRYIVEGIYYTEDLNEDLFAVNGMKMPANAENVTSYANASNGIIYTLNSLETLPIPQTTIWEFTDISDFDSIRGISNTDYLEYYDQMEDLRVTGLDGEFTEFRYEMKSGTYNGDFLRIKTTSGTDATLEFYLPPILPANYKISINALLRVVDGIKYDAYLNDELISAGNNFSGGTYKFELKELGEVNMEQEVGNTFRIVIDGSSSNTTFCHIDYLKFEPIK